MSTEPAPELRPELLDDFYAEADEHLANIRTQLTILETSLAGTPADPAVLESIFRSIHSFKGICAMAGLRPAEQLAHTAEGALRQLSRGTLQLTADGLELLVAATQRLEQMVSAHRLRQGIPDAGELLGAFATLCGAEPALTASARDTAPPLRAPANDLAKALEGFAARGLAPWKATFAPTRELDQRGVNINAVRGRLAAQGEIASATPAVRPDGSIAFEFLLGLHDAPDTAAWQRDGVTFARVADSAAGSRPDAAAEGEASAAGSQSSTLFIAPSHIVRVDLSRLDELMRITGEMVIHRSRLEDRLGQLAGDNAALREVSLALGRSLRQLRTAITRVRLVPVAEIFTRMPFVVRDLARETGRKVRLVIEGQHTQIDKYLVERLKEPLLHLVRNAFSHGVEPPEVRTQAGKSAEATILLRASAAGEFVIIQVRDDGRGVDTAAVAQRAEALGLDVPDELDAPALLQLLCTPGFSTRAEADRASGRGVGMAVVHNTVRELGGSLSLETTPGGGTQFTLRLPLTLSIAETIIVSAAEHTCAVPQSFIDEILEVTETEVRTIKDSEVIPYRGGVLPVLRLRTMFGARASTRRDAAVLVLSSERGSTGLVVDRVHTQREIVVRAMQDPLVQVPGIAGATELGDGRPVLILDPVAITNGVVRPRAAILPAANRASP